MTNLASDFAVSWKKRRSDYPENLSYENLVEIFYDQTLGWQLHIADLIANGGQPLGPEEKVERIEHSGFAVVAICLSYFELVGMIEEDTKNRKAFDRGVAEVFPHLNKAIYGQLYVSARCGLYHSGRTRHSIRLALLKGEPIQLDSPSKTVVIDPRRLPRKMKAHLEILRERLIKEEGSAYGKRFKRRMEDGFK